MFVNRLTPLAPLAGLLTLIAFSVACQKTEPSSEPAAPLFTFEGCIEDDNFFEYHVHEKVIGPICLGCHTQGGQAGDSSMVFVTDVFPDHFIRNAKTFEEMAGLERDGTSIVLLKPLGLENHQGGTVIAQDGEAYAILEEFVRRLDSPPVVCEDESLPTDDGLQILLASPTETLRSATLNLAGRLPYPHELLHIEAAGEAGLPALLKKVMEEDAFAEKVMEMFGDLLLTDKYLIGHTGVEIIDRDRYEDHYWFYEILDNTQRGQSRLHTGEAFGREPLELIRHIILNNLPFSEILTADYTMINRYSARSLGLHQEELDYTDPTNDEFYPVQLEGIPHAGVLTTAAYLNRFPSTPTNRNRHRARVFLNNFLSTDVLAFAERPIDPTQTSTHNPTLNDPQCTLCHDTIDPIAGDFQNWDDLGHYYPPEEGWYPSMKIPGFEGEMLNLEDRPTALQWLARKTINDSRFGLAMVNHLLTHLTGIEIVAPKHINNPAQKEAAERLQGFLQAEALRFSGSDFDLRASILRIILSPYYRARSHNGGANSHGDYLRNARLLSPEELSRKIHATMGMPWVNRRNQMNLMTERFNLFYGGVDFDSVVKRLKEPNGIMASVSLRMASEMACVATARDFLLTGPARRLFPLVETTYAPETTDGFTIPEIQDTIKQNIAYLHYRLLGESLAIDDPEVLHTYTLLLETWREGNTGIESGEISANLPWSCSSNWAAWTQEAFPKQLQLRTDPNYMIRSWTAVISYLLSDYRFLYQ